MELVELTFMMRSSDQKSTQFIPMVRFLESLSTIERLEKSLANEDVVESTDALTRAWVLFYRLKVNKESIDKLLSLITR